MATEAIIAALITGGCAVVSQVIISARSTRELYSKLDKQSEIADERIKGEIAVVKAEIADLRKTVEKHNNMIERTYKLEQQVAVQDEQIKAVNNRIKDLELAAQH